MSLLQWFVSCKWMFYRQLAVHTAQSWQMDVAAQSKVQIDVTVLSHSIISIKVHIVCNVNSTSHIISSCHFSIPLVSVGFNHGCKGDRTFIHRAVRTRWRMVAVSWCQIRQRRVYLSMANQSEAICYVKPKISQPDPRRTSTWSTVAPVDIKVRKGSGSFVGR